MGTSTDAILFFGYLLEYNEGEEHQMQEELFDDNGEYVGMNPIYDENGFDIVIHCSYDYPMYGIATPSANITAWRGHPQTFENGLKDPPQEEIERLNEIAKKYNLPIGDQKPSWHLVSMWG